jgi:endosialidase-like protein
MLDILNPRDIPYSALGDGVTDDAAALNAALSSGAMVIDGGGLTYFIGSQVTVPLGVRFQNAILQMADANFTGLAYSSYSAISGVKVLGTHRINQPLPGQIGIGAVSPNQTEVYLRAAVDGCNRNFDHWGTTFSTLRMLSKNASGLNGASEGYGCLLYMGASDNHVKLISRDDARHALYLSAGASRNKCVSTSSGVKTSYAVQINCQRDQLPCVGNVITGSDYNSAGGVVIAMQATANPDAGGAVNDNIVHDFTVTADASTNTSPAFLMSFPAGLTASANAFVNCKARGTFNHTSLGVCHVAGGKNRRVQNMDINAVCKNASTGAFVAQPSSGGGMDTFDGLKMDLQSSGSNIIGAYFDITSGKYSFNNSSIICVGANKVYFSGAADTLRVGPGNEWSANAVAPSVGAGAVGTVTVTLPSDVALNTKIQATIISQGSSPAVNSSVQMYYRTGTSAVFNVFNGYSGSQSIVFSVHATGLPA